MARSSKKTSASERRRFPRKEYKIKVKLMAVKDRDVVFEAHLASRDISIGGIFLESEFFVKSGTRLRAEFDLPKRPETVVVEGVVVREERIKGRSGGLRPGFAIRFTEYIGDAKLGLAGYFLAPEVQKFVEDYSKARRGISAGDQRRMVDLVVAWELNRFEQGKGWIMP
ncbi:MAG TPA: PilZ domain-containing protein [Myxococcota bacterium]|nr:PilZ domain-containing protein [Myxococcota bacterium]